MRRTIHLLAFVAGLGCGGGQHTTTLVMLDAAGADRGTASHDGAAVSPPDAPPSTCSPDAGCGPGETCWLGLNGAHACARYTVQPPRPVPSWVSSCEPADGGFAGDQPPKDCCTHDDQCTAQPRGRCVPRSHCGGVAGRRSYGVCGYNLWCTSDADCGPRGACLPSSPGSAMPTCVSGACRTSADCTRQPGGQCLTGHTGGSCGGGYHVLYCSYPGDACQVGGSGCGDRMRCVPAEDGHGTRCQIDPGQPP